MAYTKLSGKQRDLSGYKQLWLGEDHILLVQSSRFTEQYRKFALSDIQAIVVTSQPTAVSLRAMMAILMAMLLGGALLTDSNGLKIALALFAAIPFVILVSDMARGPRVACRLCTEVSAELLPITRASAFRGFQFGSCPPWRRRKADGSTPARPSKTSRPTLPNP